jgi:DNA polymerase elongation subunit (family B)
MGKSKRLRVSKKEREIIESLRGVEIKNKQNRLSLSEIELDALSKERKVKPIKRLFFDIETAPMVVYTWRIGWKINLNPTQIIDDWKIICISYMWEGDNKVQNLTWDKNHCDKKMLEDFVKIANESDEMIAHNGDRFDIKKIRTRCIFHRVPMFPNYKTLDTLKKAKSGFNFNSNRLDYIAKFLGVGAKLVHEGFDMWKKCMDGDDKALKDMVEYCDMDIIVLSDVFHAMQNYIKHNSNTAAITNQPKHHCANCGGGSVELNKNIFTAAGTIKRQMECNSCGYVYEISNTAYKKII